MENSSSSAPEFNCVTWHPSGDEVSFGLNDKFVRIYHPTTPIPLQILRGHAGDVEYVAYSRSGSRLLSLDTTGLAIVWSRVHPNHWSRQGYWRPSEYEEDSDRIVEQERLARGITTPPLFVRSVNLRYQQLASDLSASGAAAVAAAARRVAAGARGGITPALRSVSWTCDERCIVAGCSDFAIRVWRLIDTPLKPPPAAVQRLKKDDDWIVTPLSLREEAAKAVATPSSPGSSPSPTSSSSSSSGSGRFLRPHAPHCTAELVQTMIHHTGIISFVRPHPNNAHIVLSGSHDGRVIIWDISVGRMIKSFMFAENDTKIEDGSWSPDGLQIAVSTNTGRLILLGTGARGSYYGTPDEQFFASDTRALQRDRFNAVIDVEIGLPPHLCPPVPLANHLGMVHDLALPLAVSDMVPRNAPLIMSSPTPSSTSDTIALDHSHQSEQRVMLAILDSDHMDYVNASRRQHLTRRAIELGDAEPQVAAIASDSSSGEEPSLTKPARKPRRITVRSNTPQAHAGMTTGSDDDDISVGAETNTATRRSQRTRRSHTILLDDAPDEVEVEAHRMTGAADRRTRAVLRNQRRGDRFELTQLNHHSDDSDRSISDDEDPWGRPRRTRQQRQQLRNTRGTSTTGVSMATRRRSARNTNTNTPTRATRSQRRRGGTSGDDQSSPAARPQPRRRRRRRRNGLESSDDGEDDYKPHKGDSDDDDEFMDLHSDNDDGMVRRSTRNRRPPRQIGEEVDGINNKTETDGNDTKSIKLEKIPPNEWLQSIHQEYPTYVPQVGDRVVYLQHGHRQFLDKFPLLMPSTTLPPFAQLPPTQHCLVTSK
jgi:WD40 repeat protein